MTWHRQQRGLWTLSQFWVDRGEQVNQSAIQKQTRKAFVIFVTNWKVSKICKLWLSFFLNEIWPNIGSCRYGEVLKMLGSRGPSNRMHDGPLRGPPRRRRHGSLSSLPSSSVSGRPIRDKRRSDDRRKVRDIKVNIEYAFIVWPF